MVNAIRRIASEKGLSIRELEKQADIATGTIGRWDDNKPSVDKVYKVANVLGTSIDELMREEEPDDTRRTKAI